MISKDWLMSLCMYLVGSCAALAIALGTASVCQAQQVVAPSAMPVSAVMPQTQVREPAVLQAQVDEEHHKIEALQQQIDEMKQLMNRGALPIAVPATTEAEARGADKKKADDAQKKVNEEIEKAKNDADGYRIGSDMGVTANFKDGLFLWLESPHQDFTMHLGMWMQYDNVFFTQSAQMRGAQGSRSGPAQGIASGFEDWLNDKEMFDRPYTS